MESKFLNFTEKKTTGVTCVYFVSNKSGTDLGQIKWYSPWRKYVFEPYSGNVFDTECLGDVIRMITKLMTERRARGQDKETKLM